MNWHETIEQAQSDEQLRSLLFDAYLTSDLVDNCLRYRNSLEFQEVMTLINMYHPNASRALDVGAGNGIASVALALEGLSVTAMEPDPSCLVGRCAIEEVKEALRLKNIEIREGKGEDAFTSAQYDLVFARQVLHHADDLEQFMTSMFSALKPGGIMMSLRDHVVYDEEDKALFLHSHPFHKHYGGENAFTSKQYEGAFRSAGFEIVWKAGHYDSVINYGPADTFDVEEGLPESMKTNLRKVLGKSAEARWLQRSIRAVYDVTGRALYDERKVPGRLTSYLLKKPTT